MQTPTNCLFIRLKCFSDVNILCKLNNFYDGSNYVHIYILSPSLNKPIAICRYDIVKGQKKCGASFPVALAKLRGALEAVYGPHTDVRGLMSRISL